MKLVKLFNKKTKFYTFVFLLIVSLELLGRLIAFNIHSDHTTFISLIFNEKDSIKKKIRDFIFTKEINSQHYQNALINKIKNTGIDCFKISLSQKDLIHFESIINFMENNASRSDAEKLNAYRKISIEHNGTNYNAKLKLHLGEPRHWKNPKKSYSLKLSGDKLINNLEKIDFVVPEDRGYFPPLLCKELSDVAELPHPENGYCILYINDKFNGVYLLEEEFDNNPKFFEKNKLPNDLSIRPDFKDISDLVLWDSQLEFWETSAIKVDSPHSEKINDRVENYLNGLRSMDFDLLRNLVDLEKVAAVTAMKTFWGYSHDYIERNIRLVYSLNNGLIYYQPRAEDGAKNLQLNSAHLPYSSEKGQYSFEHGMNYFYKTKYLRMFYPFLRNNQFRDRRNFYFKKFILENKIESKINELSKHSLDIFPLDPFSKFGSQTTTFLIEDQVNTLQSNVKKIKNVLSSSSLFIKVFKSGDLLRIRLLPDSLARLTLNNFKISLPKGLYSVAQKNIRETTYIQEEVGYLDLSKFFENEYLMANLDSRLLPQKNYFEVVITGDNLGSFHEENIFIAATNTFTGQVIPDNRMHTNVLDSSSDYSKSKTIDAQRFVDEHNYLNLNLNKNVLTLKSGVYKISEDLIIPSGLILSIESGTVLNVAEQKSIISFSPIQFNGTLQSPITIRCKNDDSHFGVIAINLQNASNIRINNLHIIRGSEAFANGVFYNGALSIHNGIVRMKSCIIRDSGADDGINFKNSNAEITDCFFIDNKSDHIDLDFCTGIIGANKFNNLAIKNVGDAIDLSGSSVIIRKNRLIKSGDKAISVGEKSKVIIFDNVIKRNEIGIAVKDSSKAIISNNSFSTNETNLSCYIKKGIFGGGTAYLRENSNLPTNSIQLDDSSDFFRLSSFDVKVFDIQPTEVPLSLDSVFQSVNLNFIK
ncbi:MAG: CotH kinase family protein [Opitutales bacterium]|nr:CotH kinase family protein [Opitutales bacterium]